MHSKEMNKRIILAVAMVAVAVEAPPMTVEVRGIKDPLLRSNNTFIC